MLKLMHRRIGVARRALGVRRDDFADLAQIAPDVYAAIEAGTATPELTDLVEIARLTGKSLDFLIAGGPINTD